MASTAASRSFREKPLPRPAIAKLAVRRFTSHSHGPGVVSSKSLTSKTRVRSGEANVPKFWVPITGDLNLGLKPPRHLDPCRLAARSAEVKCGMTSGLPASTLLIGGPFLGGHAVLELSAPLMSSSKAPFDRAPARRAAHGVAALTEREVSEASLSHLAIPGGQRPTPAWPPALRVTVDRARLSA